MAQAIRWDLIADPRRFQRGFREAERTSDRFGRTMGRVGSLLAGAFAGVAVTAGIKSTIDAASDLNESISKSRVVFGRSAKAVEVFAKIASKNLGQSRQQALEATATFGNLFVSMKLGQKPAADMSVKLVRLASDLASFNNVNPAEALEALRSGLVGETEPLRRFGINLNDADLRQRALALGLTKTTKNVLPPAIKAQAAYSLIMEQSKTAQGDFARTADGAANRQRILAARVEDLKASIGQGLLPAYAAVLGFITDRFIPTVSRLADKIIPPLRDALAGAGELVTPLTEAIQEKFDTFKLDAKVFGRNLAAKIKGTAQAVIVGFQVGLKTGDWSQLGAILGNVLRQAIGNGADLMQRAFAAVDWFEVGKVVGRVAGSFGLGFVNTMWDGVLDTFKKHPVESALTLAMIVPVGKVFGLLGKFLKGVPILKHFAPIFTKLESLTQPFRTAGGKLIRFLGSGLGEGLERVFPTVGKRLRGKVGDLIAWITLRFEAMRNAGHRLIRGLVVGIGEQIGLVVRNIGQVVAALTRPFRGAIGWLFNAGRNVLRGLWRGLLSIWDDIKRWFGGIPSWIRQHKGPLSLDAALLVPAGQAIMGGFLRGLRSGASGALGFLQGIVGDIAGIFSGGPIPKGVQALAQRMAAGYGWTGPQWNALRTLVQNESGWNPNAQNPTSSAYGLFQFLDSTWASVGATKTSSPVGQIAAGLRYIKSRYGSPANALAFWMSHTPHWYGQGLAPSVFRRPTLIGVGERGPEAVSVTPLHRAGRGGGMGADELADALVRALQRYGLRVAVDDIHTGLLAKKRGQGRVKLGLD